MCIVNTTHENMLNLNTDLLIPGRKPVRKRAGFLLHTRLFKAAAHHGCRITMLKMGISSITAPVRSNITHVLAILKCLLYNSEGRFDYILTALLAEMTAEKVLSYVHSHPDRFRVENFGGFRLSDITFKYKEEILLVNGNRTDIGYKLDSIPIGENHWIFFVSGENSDIMFGDDILP